MLEEFNTLQKQSLAIVLLLCMPLEVVDLTNVKKQESLIIDNISMEQLDDPSYSEHNTWMKTWNFQCTQLFIKEFQLPLNIIPSYLHLTLTTMKYEGLTWEDRLMILKPFQDLLCTTHESNVKLYINVLVFIILMNKYDSRGRVLLNNFQIILQLNKIETIWLENQLCQYLLELQDNDLTNKKNNKNKALRYAKIGAVALGAGAVLAVTGGLAAPAVAGALILMGSSTAVVAAVTTTSMMVLFGGTGAGLAGYKMTRLTQGLNDFEFNCYSNTKKLAVIIMVSGFMEEDEDDKRVFGVLPADIPLKERLLRYYTLHAPDRVCKVSNDVACFEDDPEMLFYHLKDQYQYDPQETDSLIPRMPVSPFSDTEEEMLQLQHIIVCLEYYSKQNNQATTTTTNNNNNANENNSSSSSNNNISNNQVSNATHTTINNDLTNNDSNNNNISSSTIRLSKSFEDIKSEIFRDRNRDLLDINNTSNNNNTIKDNNINTVNDNSNNIASNNSNNSEVNEGSKDIGINIEDIKDTTLCNSNHINSSNNYDINDSNTTSNMIDKENTMNSNVTDLNNNGEIITENEVIIANNDVVIANNDVVMSDNIEEKEKDSSYWSWRELDICNIYELNLLHWERDLQKQLGSSIYYFIRNLSTVATEKVLTFTVLNALAAAAALPIFLLSLLSNIDSMWAIASAKAKEAGIEMAKALLARPQGQRPVTLVGFSMGAKVIYYCLRELYKHSKQAVSISKSNTDTVPLKDNYNDNNNNDTDDNDFNDNFNEDMDDDEEELLVQHRINTSNNTKTNDNKDENNHKEDKSNNKTTYSNYFSYFTSTRNSNTDNTTTTTNNNNNENNNNKSSNSNHINNNESMQSIVSLKGLIQDVVLLGCPVNAKSKTWIGIRSLVGGRLINGYSNKDIVLSLIYRYDQFKISVAGITPVCVAGVENIDLTHIVKQHNHYSTKMKLILQTINLSGTPYESK